MKRWEWLGPAIGATFYVTGLTAVLLSPIEDVFFSFSDPVDGDVLLAVEIATLPGAGALTNSGVVLVASDMVRQAIVTNHTSEACPGCGTHGHLMDANFCRKCGEPLSRTQADDEAAKNNPDDNPAQGKV